MKKIYLPFIAASLLFSVGCTDDKYDLGDVDTTTAIKINGLVVPVNLSEITLDQVLDIDDDDPDNIIKVYTDTNGKKYYAIEKNGNFNADEVYVKELDADVVTVYNLPLVINDGKIENISTEFSYLVNNVDKSISKLYRLGMKEGYEMTIQLSVTEGNANLENVVVSLPDMFTATYHGSTVGNLVNLGNIEAGSSSDPILVQAMDFGNGIEPSENHSLDIRGDIGIQYAEVVGDATGMKVKFDMSKFTANSISGQINYEIDAPEIQPVSLNDLPDFLKDGETSLILENPQLYLNFGNPLGAPFHTSLVITQIGNGGGSRYAKVLEPFITSTVLAPDPYDLGLNQDSGAVLQTWTDLKYILMGDGLPESLEFKLGETYVRGDVLNLQLGSYMSVSGNYTFFTPLALAYGSRIIYQKSEKDFFGDDVKDVKVSKFQLTANPKTNLPFAVSLTLYPLDKNGNKIKDKSGNVVSATGNVKANADGNTPLNLDIDQEFTGLDGVEYVVTVDDLSGESLSPDQYIELTNIRAKLSGEYVTKL